MLDKEMATHSSTLAWEIPRTEEPGGLESMESQRVRHDWAHKHTKIKFTNIRFITYAKCLEMDVLSMQSYEEKNKCYQKLWERKFNT